MPDVRGHNEGSCFQRKTGPGAGRWVAAVQMRDGRRVTRWSKSRDEAKAALAELLRLRDAGAADTSRLRLGTYLERWVSREHGWAPATQRKHVSAVRVHLAPRLGAVRMSELSVADVDGMLLGLDVGPQSARHVRATLRRALKDAQRDGLISRNVAALSRAPRLPNRERTILDATGARLLIESTRDTRFGPLWVILVTTGLRISEALGLAWSDVVLADKDNDFGGNDAETTTARDVHPGGGANLGTGLSGTVRPRGGRGRDNRGPTLTVRHALQRVDGEWQLRPPKTAKGRRQISLTPLGVEALRAQRAMQLADRYGDGMDDTLRPRRRRGDSYDFSGPLEPRFWAKVDRRGPDECWPWLAATDHRGYGSFLPRIEGERMAHRITYTLLVGPIPDGLTLDHLCRNKACQNPDHMEPVTREENVRRDMVATGRAVPYPPCTHGPERRRVRAGKGSYCIDCMLERRRAILGPADQRRAEAARRGWRKREKGGNDGDDGSSGNDPSGGSHDAESQASVVDVLVAELPAEARRDHGAVLNIEPLQDSLVFTTDKGNPIHATNLLPVLRADLAAAGLPKVGLHSLRHSAATILITRGYPIEKVAKIFASSLGDARCADDTLPDDRRRSPVDACDRRREVGLQQGQGATPEALSDDDA